MRVGLTLQVALATAAGGLLAGLLSLWVGLSTLDVTAAVVVRAVTVLALLVTLPYRLVRRRNLGDHRLPLRVGGAAGVLLGYAANPMAWEGRAFFTQLFTRPGALTTTVDLLGWVIVGALAVVVASRPAARRHQPVSYRR